MHYRPIIGREAEPGRAHLGVLDGRILYVSIRLFKRWLRADVRFR